MFFSSLNKIFLSFALLCPFWLFSCLKRGIDTNKVSATSDLPALYDLRDFEIKPLIKEQAWGTCWAFATMLSLESNLIKSSNWSGKHGPMPSLSPYYLDKYSGFTRKGADSHLNDTWYSGQGNRYPGSNTDQLNNGLVVHLGGDYFASSAFLTNHKGAVPQGQTPVIPRKGDHKLFGDLPTEGVLKENNYEYYFPKKIIWLTKSGTKEEKRRKVKKAIMEHGAVASVQLKKDAPIAVAPDGLPVHGIFNKKKKPDHAINLIGWNDRILIGGHYGAWLAQDSDHRTADDKPQGYFYVLYDDIYVATHPQQGGVSFQETDLAPFSEVYSHSLHGHRYTTAPEDQVRGVANKFKAKKDHTLKGVGLYTSGESTTFTLEIKSDLKGKSLLEEKGNLHMPGFHYVDLSHEKLKWPKGSEIVAVLTLSDHQYAYDASSTFDLLLGNLPPWGQPVSVHSKANPQESFWLKEGPQKNTWQDFSTFVSKHNGQADHPHAAKNATANIALNLYVD